MEGGQARVRISAAPSTDQWDRDDNRWRAALFELEQDVRRADPSIVERSPGSRDDKGVELVSVLIALGSSGAFTAMVEGFKAWLGNRKGRGRIDLTIDTGTSTKTVVVDASNVDGADLTKIVLDAIGAEPEE